MIYELCEQHPTWDIVLLSEDAGVFVGPPEALNKILDNTNIEEEY